MLQKQVKSFVLYPKKIFLLIILLDKLLFQKYQLVQIKDGSNIAQIFDLRKDKKNRPHDTCLIKALPLNHKFFIDYNKTTPQIYF